MLPEMAGPPVSAQEATARAPNLAAGGSSSLLFSVSFQVGRLLAGEDIFSALDSILERINDLQQLVSSWSDNLSEDDSQRCSSSSTAASSSLDSPPLCPSSPSHIHLEVQHPEEVARSGKKGMENGEEHEMRSQPIRSR